MHTTIQTVCMVLKSTRAIQEKFDETLTGMWGRDYYEANREDSCLVPAGISLAWAVELQQPTMPEQERRSHGFEVTPIQPELNQPYVAFFWRNWINHMLHFLGGDLGGGADAEATQICSSTSESENGQRWRKAQGVKTLEMDFNRRAFLTPPFRTFHDTLIIYI